MINSLSKSLMSIVLNRNITNDEIMKIDPKLIKDSGLEEVLKEIKNEILKKKDFSEQTVAINLSTNKNISLGNITLLLQQIRELNVGKRNLEDITAKLLDAQFRKKLDTEIYNISRIGPQVSSEKVLAEINRVASLRPYTESVTLDAIINSKTSDILSGDDIIKFGGFIGKIAGGLTLGEESVLGARPGGGKTNTVINIMDYMAINHPEIRVLVLSREMTNTQLIKRLLLLNAQGTILYDDLRTGEPLTGQQEEVALKVIENMKEKYKNIVVVDDAVTIDDGISAILTYQPKLVIDDYLGVIEDEEIPQDKIRFLINKVLKAYKWLCKSLNIHIMNISQLNREIEKRLDPEPLLSDFNESGLIEQICELAIAIRPGSNKNELNYWALKARHGKIQTISVKYEPAWCKIYIGE